MKKTIFAIALITFTSLAFAQQVRQTNQMFGDNATFSGIKSSTGRVLTYDDISGTPYPNKNFATAKIGTSDQRILVRYNSYNDEVEFKKDDQILSLLKTPEYSRVEIISPKQTLVLLETNDDLSGYFFEITSGKNSLYKKIKTKFIDAVPAATSYSTDKPAFFKTSDPVYYIKTENNFIKKPKNQKEIIEALPNLKNQINAFIKENKIKLNKEEDLIKLVNFLNQQS